MLVFDPETQTIGGVRLQTFRHLYTEILDGEQPWVALGKMMHQFFGYYSDSDFRTEIVRESIEVPETPTPEQWRWAVWCAASVEYLCAKYELECPAWTMDDRYTLTEPWYRSPSSDLPEVQKELQEEAPEAFAHRNIYCEANPYRNKYERPLRRTA